MKYQYQKNEAKRMMDNIRPAYMEDDEEYNTVMNIMLDKALEMVAEDIDNGKWGHQDHIIERINTVFDMTAECESFEDVIAMCKS